MKEELNEKDRNREVIESIIKFKPIQWVQKIPDGRGDVIIVYSNENNEPKPKHVLDFMGTYITSELDLVAALTYLENLPGLKNEELLPINTVKVRQFLRN